MSPTATTERGVKPVENYRDAAPLLRRPFTQQAVKFKVQATFPKDNPDAALIVAYIDARLAIERLNMVCPALWHTEFEPTNGGLMWCHLTIDGITRRDVGEGLGKALVSDALKRAAVHFGVGVSLYAIPKTILKKNGAEHLKEKGDTLVITPQGEARCRELYAAWLKNAGEDAFGEPLDHGDADEATGDSEIDQ